MILFKRTIAFGHEYVNASIFASYLEGMKKVEDLPDTALDYFRSHVDDEPDDYMILKKIIIETLAAGG